MKTESANFRSPDGLTRAKIRRKGMEHGQRGRVTVLRKGRKVEAGGRRKPDES